jgi:hypothetical protein
VALESKPGRALLRFCEKQENPTIELPSWVPDWSKVGSLMIAHTWPGPAPTYCAGGSINGHFQVQRDAVLSAQGYILDEIVCVLTPLVASDTFSFPNDRVDGFFLTLYTFAGVLRRLLSLQSTTLRHDHRSIDKRSHIWHFLLEHIPANGHGTVGEVPSAAIELLTAVEEKNEKRMMKLCEDATARQYLYEAVRLTSDLKFCLTSRGFIGTVAI